MGTEFGPKCWPRFLLKSRVWRRGYGYVVGCLNKVNPESVLKCPWPARLYKFLEPRKYRKNTQNTQKRGLPKIQEKYTDEYRKNRHLDTPGKANRHRTSDLDTGWPKV